MQMITVADCVLSYHSTMFLKPPLDFFLTSNSNDHTPFHMLHFPFLVLVGTMTFSLSSSSFFCQQAFMNPGCFWLFCSFNIIRWLTCRRSVERQDLLVGSGFVAMSSELYESFDTRNLSIFPEIVKMAVIHGYTIVNQSSHGGKCLAASLSE